MSLNFELPRITTENPDGQLAEVRSYLWQLVEKLNYAFNFIDIDGEKAQQTASGGFSGTGGGAADEKTIDYVTETSTFNGGNYTAVVRTWKSGFREAYIKTAGTEFQTPRQVGNSWVMNVALQLTPLPPGFTKSNLVACSASLAGNNADATAYVFYVGDKQMRVNIMSPREISGSNYIRGNIMVYLAAK